MIKINPLKVKRKTKQEVRYHPDMGALSTQVTRIQKMLLGFPLKTVHKYRTTYHGKIKDCEKCNPAMI